jgi:tetratricopeptide (TPR) repeat protein
VRIGTVTALISLIAGSFQLNGLLQASRERSEAVQKLVKAADMQIEYGDLESALQLVEQAIELQPGSRAAGERQVTVAMMLFRRGADFCPKGYAEKIDSLMPVLYRGAMDADPARAADALAHIGRANKMRRSAQNKEFPIEEYFQRAVALDADNVFAHVFWAVSCLDNSWRMECGNNLEAAEEHFAMAMKDGRLQDYVRQKRFDSLRATSVEGADILLIGDMITSWRNKVPLDERQQDMILKDVSGFYDPDE